MILYNMDFYERIHRAIIENDIMLQYQFHAFLNGKEI